MGHLDGRTVLITGQALNVDGGLVMGN